MANVNTTVIIEVSGHGTFTLGKHGALADSLYKPHILNVTGAVFERVGTLTPAAFATIYDSTNDLPATIKMFFFWMDQTHQINLVTANTQFTITGAASRPTVLGSDSTLGFLCDDDSTTNITAVQTLDNLDEITIHNLIGNSTANYHLILVL